MADVKEHRHDWVKVRIVENFAYGMTNHLTITWACSCGVDKQTHHDVVRNVEAQNV